MAVREIDFFGHIGELHKFFAMPFHHGSIEHKPYMGDGVLNFQFEQLTHPPIGDAVCEHRESVASVQPLNAIMEQLHGIGSGHCH